MLGRFVGGYALGRIADCVGRKPVMIGGLVSITTFSLTFGLSFSFASAVGSRWVQQGPNPPLPEELRIVMDVERCFEFDTTSINEKPNRDDVAIIYKKGMRGGRN